MKDNEIIKGLECCQTEYDRKCKQGCPYMQFQKKCISVDTCSSRLRADLLDLINRQKAEIERLEEEVDIVSSSKRTILDRIPYERSEAINEFVEKFKEDCHWVIDDKYIEEDIIKYIDNIVKEMTKEERL